MPVMLEHYSMLPVNLRVNIPEIDFEHDELFYLLEGFKEDCFSESAMSRDKRDALYRLLESHFKTEKRLAKVAGVHFAEHELAHEKMLESVSQALHQIQSNNSDIYSIVRYIGYWFEMHILHYDIVLAKKIASSQLC